MVQKSHICKTVYWSALGFQILLLLFLHSLIVCHILLFECWIFSIPSRCQTVWIQIRPDVFSGLIWIHSVCKGYQQMTKVATSWQGVKHRTTSWYYFLAKTLAKVNFIWLKLFPFGLSVDFNKIWARVSPDKCIKLLWNTASQTLIISYLIYKYTSLKQTYKQTLYKLIIFSD